MANSPDLTSRALALIQRAVEFLSVRAEQTASPFELQHINDWLDTLNDSAMKISQLALTDRSADQTALQDLDRDLSLTEEQIRSLQENYEFADLIRTMEQLHENVSLLVGPHGPGGGNPIGRRPGQGNPRGRK